MFQTKFFTKVMRNSQLIDIPYFTKESEGTASIGSVMDGVQTIMLAFLITNLALSVILGDGLQHMWNLINYLQLLYFLPLINVNFHELSQTVFQLLAFVTADFFSFVPQGFGLILNLNDLDERQYNERFTNLNFEGVLLISNYYQKLEVFIILFCIYPIFLIGKKINNRILSMPFKYLYGTMTFNFPMQFFTEMYLELAVTIWLNMYAGIQFDNYSQYMATGIAVIVFIIVSVYPILVYSIIMTNFDKLSLHSFHARFGATVECITYKLNSTLNQMWIPLFLFRRYTYSAILVVLDQPVLQIMLCISQSVMTLIFMLRTKPFDSWDLNLLFVVNELTILISFIITTCFMMDYSDDEGKMISWALISVMGLDVVTNLGFVIYDLYAKFKKLFIKIKLRYQIYQRKKNNLPYDDLIKLLYPEKSQNTNHTQSEETKRLKKNENQMRKGSKDLKISEFNHSQINLVDADCSPDNKSKPMFTEKNEDIFVSLKQISHLKRKQSLQAKAKKKLEEEIKVKEIQRKKKLEAKKYLPIDIQPTIGPSNPSNTVINNRSRRLFNFPSTQISINNQEDTPNLHDLSNMQSFFYNDITANHELLNDQTMNIQEHENEDLSRDEPLQNFRSQLTEFDLSNMPKDQQQSQAPVVINIFNIGQINNKNQSKTLASFGDGSKKSKKKGKKSGNSGARQANSQNNFNSNQQIFTDSVVNARVEQQSEVFFKLDEDNLDNMLDRIIQQPQNQQNQQQNLRLDSEQNSHTLTDTFKSGTMTSLLNQNDKSTPLQQQQQARSNILFNNKRDNRSGQIGGTFTNLNTKLTEINKAPKTNNFTDAFEEQKVGPVKQKKSATFVENNKQKKKDQKIKRDKKKQDSDDDEDPFSAFAPKFTGFNSKF
eukprot:403338732